MTSESLRLEPASVDDAPLFTAMDQLGDTGDFILAGGREAHAQALAAGEPIYLRIVADDAVAGYFVLAPDPDGRSVECRRIVVTERGRGIGQGAIPLMEDHCRRALGRSRVWLDVFDDNARARHVYEKLGYVRCGETEYSGRRALVYEKELG
ncbi:MAG: GNAT family N-acetyltransferase [Halofilum sp. (in: g-proteobacteria)]|nr:GNAT family N-acetyltransferase [Halofilum sp. (in: g-proteobacteria)]